MTSNTSNGASWTTAERPQFEQTSCNLCGGDGVTVVYARCPDRRHWLPGLFDVVRCDACGLVRTNPRPTRDSIGAYYPATYSPYVAEAPPRSRAYAALRRIVRLPYTLRYGALGPWPPERPDGNRLLDVGSGSGLFLEEMAGAGWEPWAIEPSAEMAASTRTRLRLPAERVAVATAEEASFSHESFDLVTMAHVLEHLHDPKRVLRAIHGWLRPGGALRIWVPDFASLERRAFGRFWFGLDVPRHLFHFTPATLTRMLEECGFAVERIVPQYQVNTLSQSFVHVSDAVRRRRAQFVDSMRLYYGFLPLGALLLAAGSGGTLDLSARKRVDGDAREA